MRRTSPESFPEAMAEIIALIAVTSLLAVVLFVLAERRAARKKLAARELLRTMGSVEHMNDPTALHYRQMHECALWNVERIIESFPDVPEGWSARGIVLMKLGSLGDALKSFDASLRLDRRNPAALKGRGVALAELGKHAEAIGAFMRARRAEPENPEVLYCLSRLYAATAKKEQALRELSHSIRLDGRYRETALKDRDFEPLRRDAEFQRLVG